MASAKQKDAVEMLKIAAKNVKDQKTQKAISEVLGDGKGQKSGKAPKASPAKAQTEQKAAKSNGNPYRENGGYWASVEALKALGLNKMHGHEAVLAAVKKVMAAGWKPFAAKKGKLSADERALMNVSVCARKDYGAPLRATGLEVRWDGREKQAGLFKVGK